MHDLQQCTSFQLPEASINWNTAPCCCPESLQSEGWHPEDVGTGIKNIYFKITCRQWQKQKIDMRGIWSLIYKWWCHTMPDATLVAAAALTLMHIGVFPLWATLWTPFFGRQMINDINIPPPIFYTFICCREESLCWVGQQHLVWWLTWQLPTLANLIDCFPLQSSCIKKLFVSTNKDSYMSKTYGLVQIMTTTKSIGKWLFHLNFFQDKFLFWKL